MANISALDLDELVAVMYPRVEDKRGKAGRIIQACRGSQRVESVKSKINNMLSEAKFSDRKKDEAIRQIPLNLSILKPEEMAALYLSKDSQQWAFVDSMLFVHKDGMGKVLYFFENPFFNIYDLRLNKLNRTLLSLSLSDMSTDIENAIRILHKQSSVDLPLSDALDSPLMYAFSVCNMNLYKAFLSAGCSKASVDFAGKTLADRMQNPVSAAHEEFARRLIADALINHEDHALQLKPKSPRAI